MDGAADLSGPWYGRYRGDGVAPNRFVALLSEQAGALSGSVSEPDDLGVAAIRHAAVRGRREGSAVSFVKQYDGAVLAHAVSYLGVVDEAGTTLAGTWSFAQYSGTFVMERELFSDAELEAEETIALPVQGVSAR